MHRLHCHQSCPSKSGASCCGKSVANSFGLRKTAFFRFFAVYASFKRFSKTDAPSSCQDQNVLTRLFFGHKCNEKTIPKFGRLLKNFLRELEKWMTALILCECRNDDFIVLEFGCQAGKLLKAEISVGISLELRIRQELFSGRRSPEMH